MEARRTTTFSFISLLALIALSGIEAKGGSRGGSSSSSRGSSSRSSSHSSWSSHSSPSHSSWHSSPSHSAHSPSSHVSHGSTSLWHTHSPSYGWNVAGSSSTGSKSNIGWNTNSAPPAYPGLHNQPVSNSHSPPAYSPSHSNPPAYSSGHYNSPSHTPGHSPSYSNAYHTNAYGSGSYYGSSNAGYGNTFGQRGLGGNTYISSNNYYSSNNHGSSGSGFLTNALFGSGRHSHRRRHHSSSRNNERRNSWDKKSDSEWRATTQAPYFSNKVPGENRILPASAVIGAAMAFGLVSLLPLKVPAQKPLMYCNNTDLDQAPIRLDRGFIYQCTNETVEVLCPIVLTSVNSTEGINVTSVEIGKQNSTSTPAPLCENRLLVCSDVESTDSIYCSNDTLYSRGSMFCNSTTILNGTSVNETETILECYSGELSEERASFIPTTTQAPTTTTTTEKSLSIGAMVHIFLLKLIKRSDVLERSTTPEPEIPQLASSWTPEALTIPPETTTTTTTTTEAPYKLMRRIPVRYENGTYGHELREIPDYMLELDKAPNYLLNRPGEATTIPWYYAKVYLNQSTETTTPMASANTTVSEIESTSTTTTTKKHDEDDEDDYFDDDS